jgi:hypothetical protein
VKRLASLVFLIVTEGILYPLPVELVATLDALGVDPELGRRCCSRPTRRPGLGFHADVEPRGQAGAGHCGGQRALADVQPAAGQLFRLVSHALRLNETAEGIKLIKARTATRVALTAGSPA